MHVKTLILEAGAIYVGQDAGTVHFRASGSEEIISQYRGSIRSVEDVTLAIEAHREAKAATAWDLQPVLFPSSQAPITP
jgi:hypothetical protein